MLGGEHQRFVIWGHRTPRGNFLTALVKRKRQAQSNRVWRFWPIPTARNRELVNRIHAPFPQIGIEINIRRRYDAPERRACLLDLAFVDSRRRRRRLDGGPGASAPLRPVRWAKPWSGWRSRRSLPHIPFTPFQHFAAELGAGSAKIILSQATKARWFNRTDPMTDARTRTRFSRRSAGRAAVG